MGLFGHKSRERVRDDLLRKMGQGKVCAEIGVFRGDFSERILLIARPRQLHLIDPWKYEPDPSYEKAVYGSTVAKGQPAMDRVFNSVRERFDQEIQVGTVVIHRTTSDEAAGKFEGGYFDWVYIDGNHLYEFVMRDLENYDPKVKPGGYITGDDYGVAGWWQNGVTRAVDEFAARDGYDKRLTSAGQFLLRKR
jgi:Methyltransferase domain